MSFVGTYSGLIGTSASSGQYSAVSDILTRLPDNNSNMIVASDIRDSVYSLWAKIDDVLVIASQSSSASSYFTNNNIVPITVGGITGSSTGIGATFSGTYSFQQMFDMLLYPYISPSGSLDISVTTRQFGAPLSTTLNWAAIKNTTSINSIVVGGVPQVPTGNSQSGTQVVSSTHSITPGLSQSSSFTMSVSDGSSTSNYTTTLTWMNNRYWGYVDLSSIGNPNLTTNPGSSSTVGLYMTDSIVYSMSGAGANGQLFGSELSDVIYKVYESIDGSGNHLVFGFPTLLGTPSFNVNGVYSTAFTKVRSNSSFKNEYGFNGVSYDIWVSNTLQNSPLNIIIS